MWQAIVRPCLQGSMIVVLTLLPASSLSGQGQQLRSDATRGIPAGGPYVPAGTLFDNEQSNASTSLASQDSSGTFTARSADDFTLDGTGCASGVFEVTSIRAQIVQADAAPQAFAIDLFNDNGSGTAPASGITPFDTFVETSQAALGAFGIGTTVFEAEFDTTGLLLNANTIYWISAYGANAAANPSSFNNFFAASNGAAASTDNGVIIAPGAGVPDWTAADAVIGPPPLAFSFAVDGACGIVAPPIPALSPVGIGLLVALLLLAGVYLLIASRTV